MSDAILSRLHRAEMEGWGVTTSLYPTATQGQDHLQISGIRGWQRVRSDIILVSDADLKVRYTDWLGCMEQVLGGIEHFDPSTSHMGHDT